MKNLSLFAKGRPGLCLLFLLLVMLSCKAIGDASVDCRPVRLAVVLERGYRLCVSGGEVLILEDGSVGERVASAIVLSGEQRMRAEMLRSRLLAQGAIRVDVVRGPGSGGGSGQMMENENLGQ